MKKPITLICAQPCTVYYAWQVEVMLNNFKALRLHEHFDIHCIWAYNKKIPSQKKEVELIIKLDDAYEDVAKFFYYEDTRVQPSYISSIRFNILKQHFAEVKEIHPTVFYHDCDIVFTKFPDYLEKFIDGNDWYVTDTRHYLGYNYVLSKGRDVLEKMLEIMDIDEETVKQREDQAGGAQYVLKNITPDFFEEAEHNSNRLFKEITQLNKQKVAEDPKYHTLQIWAADMWVMAWQAWKRGINTVITEELSMALATDAIDAWERKKILHNAGITEAMSDTNFFKAGFRDKLPYKIDPEVYDKTKISYLYAKMVKNTGDISCYAEKKSNQTKFEKVTEIVKAFAAKVNPTKEAELIAKVRIATCMECEHWEKTILGVHRCELCGCTTAAKIFTDQGAKACPADKWIL